MSYDEPLAERIRTQLAGEPGLAERRMFGGLAFMVDGHLAVCAGSGGGLMLRADPVRTEALLRQPCVQRVVMRGREIDGWLHVNTDELTTEEQFAAWISQSITYARSLPPK